MSTIFMNPRFVILYRNRDDIREHVEQWIADIAQKGFGLNEKPLRTPFFETRLAWPPTSDIFKFPMWIQCEEVEFVQGKLVSIRKLVIDVTPETNTMPTPSV